VHPQKACKLISMRKCVVGICLIVLPAIAAAQVKGDEPIKTTICELVKLPDRFSGKMVSVGGRVLIGFEDFRLDTIHCDGSKIHVWLEYGSGPKRQPTTWCCGDMVPRDPLRVVQNSDFTKFDRYLTAQSRTSGCDEGQCYLYEVTVILTGRFDAVETVTCPDGTSLCPKGGGFGHFGLSCSRIVIKSVSDVVAKPTDPSVYEKKK
jgi:hypothetical protein